MRVGFYINRLSTLDIFSFLSKIYKIGGILKKLVLVAFIFLSCSTKYTKIGEKDIISKDEKTISYDVSIISKPSSNSPYLTLKTEEKVRIIEKYREKMKVEKSPNFLTFSPLLGIIPGFLFMNNGYVVLGRDIIGLSVLSTATIFTGAKIAPSRTIWRTQEKKYTKTGIPYGKKFSITLKGENYSLDYMPDRNGRLEVSMVDFAPFYQKGKDFNFSLISPEGDDLKSFYVYTYPLGDLLSKRKRSKYPPNIEYTVNFSDDKGNKDMILDAYESGNIILEIKNKGKGFAEDIEVRITPLSDVEHISFRSKNIIKNMIKPQKRFKAKIPVYANSDLKTGEVRLKIDILEPYFGADAKPKILRFKTKKYIPPVFVIHDKGVEEGWIEPRKTAHLSVVLQNKGGEAYDVRTKILLPAGVSLVEGKKEAYLGDFTTEDWKRLNFTLYVSPRFKEDSLKMNLLVEEKRGEKEYINLNFPIKQKVEKPKEIVIAGREKGRKGIAPLPTVGVDVDMDIPKTGISSPKDIAVVIGLRSYSNPNIPTVEYALNDAKIIKEYLINVLGFKEENIIYRENPSKGELEAIFGTYKEPEGQLFNYVIPGESNVFVYYSGHGAPDIDEKRAYLVPYDGNPSYIKISGYSLNLLFENISNVPAREKTIIIDACFSGNSQGGMLLKEISPLTVVPIREKDYKDMNIITAGKEGEVAGWYSEKRHGLFTYFFLKGLRGEADKNNDNEITFGELEGYLKENVPYYARRLLGTEQHPVFNGSKGEVLIKW